MWICLIATLLSSTLFMGIGIAPATPSISIYPVKKQTNPGTTFSIDINVADIPFPGIAAWELKLTWDTDLTEFPPTVTEGNFLSQGYLLTDMKVDAQLAFRYIMVGCMLLEPGASTGNGKLCTVEFIVKESGSSDLTLFETHLIKEDDTEFPHDLVHSFFYTTKPYVTFKWSPSEPLPDTVTTFNASGCYDPDNEALPDPTPGPIASYAWDFGDGGTGSGMVVEHTYTAYKTSPGYMVSLTVTDDDGEMWVLTKELRIWRDVAVVDIWPSNDWFDSVNNEYYHGQPNYYDDPMQYLDVLVTVVNIGTITQTCTIYLYADLDTSVIGDELQLHWWGMNQYDYFPATLKPDTGTGWGGDFMWWNEYSHSVAPSLRDVGDYTLTAKVVTADDQDLSNNVMTYGFPIHFDPEGGVKAITMETKAYHIKSQDGNLDFEARVQNFEKPLSAYSELYAQVVFEVVTSGGVPIEIPSDIIGPLSNDQIGTVTASWTGITDADKGMYSGSAVCYFGPSPSDLKWEGKKRISFSFKISD